MCYIAAVVKGIAHPRHPAAIVLLSAIGVTFTVGCGPRRVDLAMSEGIAAHEAGEPERAKARYEAALRLDPTALGARNNLAVLAWEDQDRARSLVNDALRRHPRFFEGRANRALIALRDGAWADAEGLVREASGLAGGLPPSAPEAWRRRAVARWITAVARYAADAPLDQLMEVLDPPLSERFSEPTPNDTDVEIATRAVVAWAALRAGAHDRIPELLATIPIDQLSTLRARVSLASGDAAAALGHLSAATGETAADAPLIRAWALAASGDDAASAEVAGTIGADALSSAGQRALARLRATLASRGGDWPSALDALDVALTHPNPPPDLWLDRAIALAHLGRIDAARVDVAGVLRDDPEHPRAQLLHATLGGR